MLNYSNDGLMQLQAGQIYRMSIRQEERSNSIQSILNEVQPP